MKKLSWSGNGDGVGEGGKKKEQKRCLIAKKKYIEEFLSGISRIQTASPPPGTLDLISISLIYYLFLFHSPPLPPSLPSQKPQR